MGLRKFIKRATRKVENFVHRATGQPNIGEAPKEDDSARSAAADAILKKTVNVQRQAGSGQIKYIGDEETQT